MTITLRSEKGQALDAAEFDENMTDLRDKPTGQVYPKTEGIGIKIDTDAPDWGWHDLNDNIYFSEVGEPNRPIKQVYQGGIKQAQYVLNDEAFIDFHMPHDYVPGTDMFIHAHWSHNSSTVTTGTLNIQFELCYSKGHGQAFFSTPVILNTTQDASTIRYQHLVVEEACSAPSGAGGLLITEDLEVDGLILVRFEVTGNTMDGGALPFIHKVDMHYQSSGLPTKGKAPDFYV